MQQIENEADLENEVQEAVAETKKLMVHSVTAISQMIDAKDSYTQEHSKRVAEYARLIAQHMEKSNYSEEELALLYRAHCCMISEKSRCRMQCSTSRSALRMRNMTL